MKSKPTDLSYVTLYKDPEYSCCEVNLEKLHNGDIVATFQQTVQGHDTGNILLVRSKDKGNTWDGSAAVTVFPRSSDHGHNLAGITQLSDGILISNTMQWKFLFDGSIVGSVPMRPHNKPGESFTADGWSEVDGIYVRKSTDNGYTWGGKIKVNIAPIRMAWVRDSIIEMADGTVLQPLCGQRYARNEGQGESMMSFVVWSDDKGDTWHSI